MSKDKIQQLLKAVGTRPQTDDSSIECIDYNWNEPHCFSKDQLAKLNMFTQKLAGLLSERFSSLCRAKYEVEITSITQVYAGEYLAKTNQADEKDYYLSFGSAPGKEFGVFVIPSQSANLWAKLLLGDSESNEAADKELSQLEQSLLYDMTSVLSGAFSTAHNKIESNPIGNIVSGSFPISLRETDEMCRISFSAKSTGSDVQTNASFMIPCGKLEIVTGKNKYSLDETTAQNSSEIIMEHINSMPVSITAKLASSQFSFEEMMDLQVNDIIMLDKKIDDPIELMIEGLTFGYGLPAQSEGNYAIQIAATDF